VRATQHTRHLALIKPKLMRISNNEMLAGEVAFIVGEDVSNAVCMCSPSMYSVRCRLSYNISREFQYKTRRAWSVDTVVQTVV